MASTGSAIAAAATGTPAAILESVVFDDIRSFRAQVATLLSSG